VVAIARCIHHALSKFLDCRVVEELNPNDLIGAAEVQAILRLSHPSSVTTYYRRYADFPRPAVDLSSSRIRLWKRQDIEEWQQNRKALS
jgi:predicted DNA-binding transcriptional regulator AlpA